MVVSGVARQGIHNHKVWVWLGEVRFGKVRYGEVGIMFMINAVRRGLAWRGVARFGTVW